MQIKIKWKSIKKRNLNNILRQTKILRKVGQPKLLVTFAQKVVTNLLVH